MDGAKIAEADIPSLLLALAALVEAILEVVRQLLGLART